MEFNLADLFEAAVDAFGEREYLVAEGQRRTFAEMEERSNRLAHHLASVGVGAGDHVGIYAYNSVEWVETLWAVFKLRAVWVNINYRYVEEELEYLFDNADLVALVYQRQLSQRVAAVRRRLPKLRHALVVEDGTEVDPEVDAQIGASRYEDTVAAASPERDFPARSPDDTYLLFTGGTTGMPKGVVWRHEDVFFALGGGIDPFSGERAGHPRALVEKALASSMQITMMPIAPLMHGATQWAVMGQGFAGNKIVLVAKFDPRQVWRLVEQEKVMSLMLTGDAMARPLVEALEEGVDYDLSSLVSISSTAAIFSPTVKEQLFSHFPNIVMSDAIGSSETGSNGITVVSPGKTSMKGGPTVNPISGTTVLDDNLEPVKPGSGVVGKIARYGDIPIGYYKDPAKTAQTFVHAGGKRYAMPGDFATIEADGTITLLGRGSQSINSGGEKIFPEEVEAAVKSHPGVYDAVVVGVPDDRWGQRVAAVIQPRPGAKPDLDDVQAHCRKKIAGYKIPREIHLVDVVQRSPSGKPDYPWAAAVAGGSR